MDRLVRNEHMRCDVCGRFVGMSGAAAWSHPTVVAAARNTRRYALCIETS